MYILGAISSFYKIKIVFAFRNPKPPTSMFIRILMVLAWAHWGYVLKETVKKTACR